MGPGHRKWRRNTVPEWFDAKKAIVYESSHGPILIKPGKPETGRVLHVMDDLEKTLALQFPHPAGACERNSMRVAMVAANVIHGFGAKLGRWHYADEVNPEPESTPENAALQSASTVAIEAELRKRIASATGKPGPDLSILRAAAKVETVSPPEPPEDPEVEAKVEAQRKKAESDACLTAKYVSIRRKDGRRACGFVDVKKIKPANMRPGDIVTGIVEMLEPNPLPLTKKPEEIPLLDMSGHGDIIGDIT